MNIIDLKWQQKSCCGNYHAIVNTDEGYLQIDRSGDEYTVSAYNSDGGNINSKYLDAIVMTNVSGDDLNKILAEV